ncbi:uncharacterized protein KGF55_004836 [Candida pseudojiufengensis]|uniref:uncharacterized protein n=1 Tax=Candida pseudojiufengensis TaxID=497109 RepID=UPI002225406E|nr:uncharacterized protein KGF55_004836 [Candida pseudojiufengensis]KAI5960113.1 hypothetical protein KGF55_004836 [Candida pseudojiufengensis]
MKKPKKENIKKITELLHIPRDQTSEARIKIHIRKKLNDIMQNNGEMIRYNKRLVERVQKSSREESTLRRALGNLKRTYDSVMFQDRQGKPFSVSTLRFNDLKFRNEQSKVIFENVMRIKDANKRQVNRTLALTLLGTNEKQLKDPYFITKNVVDLLAYDQEAQRALYLCRISDKRHAVVGMNTIMEWFFDRNDQKNGIKVFNERRNYGIASDGYTYLRLFDGVSKTSSWGKVSNEMSDRMIETFKNGREIIQDHKNKNLTTSIFNACLSILVKNFNHRQAKAWGFFDELMEDKKLNIKGIIPDSQTFTILLHGVKKYTDFEKNKILEDNTLSSHERIVKLLDLEAGHIKTAEAIFLKVKSLAMPPKETSDPEENKKLIASWLKTRIHIDMPLIATCISSLCSRESGTGVDLKGGSHYLYNERALKVLRTVSPEIELILQFLEKNDGNADELIKASQKVQNHTDLRIKLALNGLKNKPKLTYVDKIDDLIPKNVINELDNDINPSVYMNYLDKFKKTPEPLIDFKRDLNFVEKSNTKKKLKIEKKRLEELQYSVNKFLLNQTFDSLINIGKFKQYVEAFWFSLIQWGGLRIYPADLKRHNVLDNFLDKIKNVRSHQNGRIPSIIDDAMFNSFIYKVGENGRLNGSTRTNIIMEMFTALVFARYKVDSIDIKQDHIENMYSTFFKDIHYYNDSNKKTTYSTKPHLTFNQLNELLKNLQTFTNVYFAHLKKSKTSFIPIDFYNFMNKINDTINFANWLQVETLEQKIHLNKLLIKASIRYYKPKAMIEKGDDINYVGSIETNINILMKLYNEVENLDESNQTIKSGLKKLMSLGKKSKEDESVDNKLTKLQKEIYDLIDVNKMETTM